MYYGVGFRALTRDLPQIKVGDSVTGVRQRCVRRSGTQGRTTGGVVQAQMDVGREPPGLNGRRHTPTEFRAAVREPQPMPRERHLA